MAASQLLKTVRIATYTLPDSTKLMLQVSKHTRSKTWVALKAQCLNRAVFSRHFTMRMRHCRQLQNRHLSALWILVLSQGQLRKKIDTDKGYGRFFGYMPEIWEDLKGTS